MYNFLLLVITFSKFIKIKIKNATKYFIKRLKYRQIQKCNEEENNHIMHTY